MRTGRNLEQTNAQTPNVGGDLVALALLGHDLLGRHVDLTARDGRAHRVGRKSAYAEVAHFDLACRVYEDVRRLDVAVHELLSSHELECV